MTVHGGIYYTDPYLLRNITVPRDRLVQRGEVVAVWDAQPGETFENWGLAPPERPHWHISNPHVLRFAIEGVTYEQVRWIEVPWTVPGEDGQERLIAQRLWRFDVDALVAEEVLRLGRPVNAAQDVVVVDQERRLRWVRRRVEGGMMLNKAAGDIPLNDPTRIVG